MTDGLSNIDLDGYWTNGNHTYFWLCLRRYKDEIYVLTNGPTFRPDSILYPPLIRTAHKTEPISQYKERSRFFFLDEIAVSCQHLSEENNQLGQIGGRWFKTHQDG
uniref:Uncharacterized protein n=1 Tax=Coccidioides posadasii RMSCC 3488 TaxID=454284 RepID=A0A0J6F2Z8_COCPO|nr:hypothetical protein CPAG_03611 [Coccidioides posadasii RMSCC 3488]